MGRYVERLFKNNSLKLNAASHNNASWYTDTDGFLEHSPSRGYPPDNNFGFFLFPVTLKNIFSRVGSLIVCNMTTCTKLLVTHRQAICYKALASAYNLQHEVPEAYFFFKKCTYWLCYYSCPSFSPFAPLHPAPAPPHFFKQTLHHCSCQWVMHISSPATPFPILYFTSPWLFCNYLFVLPNTSTHSQNPLPLATIKTLFCISMHLFLFCFFV